MANIHRSQSSTRKGQNRAATVCCVAARGSTEAGTAVRATATLSFRPFATSTLASALPEIIELKPSQVKVVEQASSGLAAARWSARRTSGGWIAGFYAAQVGHSLSPVL